MSQYQKLLMEILSGAKDRNFSFSDLQTVLRHLGFRYRVKGDHFIYYRPDVEEIINLQPRNGKAKPYQVKQVRELIIRCHLGGGADEQI